MPPQLPSPTTNGRVVRRWFGLAQTVRLLDRGRRAGDSHTEGCRRETDELDITGRTVAGGFAEEQDGFEEEQRGRPSIAQDEGSDWSRIGSWEEMNG